MPGKNLIALGSSPEAFSVPVGRSERAGGKECMSDDANLSSEGRTMARNDGVKSKEMKVGQEYHNMDPCFFTSLPNDVVRVILWTAPWALMFVNKGLTAVTLA